METRQRSRALMSARIFDSWLVLGGIERARACAQFHTLKKLPPIETDEKNDKKIETNQECSKMNNKSKDI